MGASHVVRRLAHTTRHQEDLGDLLQWAFVIADGVILLKNGSLMAGFAVRGRDLESAEPDELRRSCASVADALRHCAGGWTLETNLHRVPVQGYPAPETTHFPTRALYQLDEERCGQFTRAGTHYITENTVLVTYTPPKSTLRRWEQLIVRSSRLDYKALLDDFSESCAEIGALLEGAFTVRSLSTDAIVRECHRCLTSQHEAVTTTHSYLSHALASVDMETGFQPRVGGDNVFVIGITSLGSATVCAQADFFNRLREPVRWHMRFTSLNHHDAERRIARMQSQWFHRRGGLRALMPSGLGSIENQDAVAMQNDASSALAAVASREVRFGYFTTALILRDGDRERGMVRARSLMQVYRDHGLPCTLESINATDAFMGTLPGHSAANLRRPLVTSANASHLFPVTMPWAGEETCPSSLFPKGSPPLLYARACGATPFRVNLHQGDVGHTLVVGATGAGKSVLVSCIALSFLRYAESRVFVFDVGESHTVPTLAAGGVHWDFMKKGAPALQPLQFLDTEAERARAVAWVESLCAVDNPGTRRDLARAVQLVAASPEGGRTLTALYLALPPGLQAALEPYTVRGPFGMLLDGCGSMLADARMQTYELGGVLKLSETVVAPLLLALFALIERRLTGAPALIVIEEAWSALLQPHFAQQLQEWLLTLRKRNAAVVVVAHSVEQLRALPNATLLTGSCPTRIILPNPDARTEETAAVYRFLGLSTRELDIVAEAQPRREYYYRCASGSRLFELDLGPVARTLLMPLPGMSTEAFRSKMLSLLQRRGDDFLDHIDEL